MPIRLLAPPGLAKGNETRAARTIPADLGVDQTGCTGGWAVDGHEDRILVLVEFVVVDSADRCARRSWPALQELRRVLARFPRLAWLPIHTLARVATDFRLQLSDVEENIGLPPQLVRYHGWLGRNRRGDRDPYAPALHRLDQRAKVAVTGEQHHMIDVPGDLHGIDGKLNVHVAFHLAAAGLINEFLGGFGDDCVAVVVEPVDQWANRGILLIFHHGGIIECAQQISARLKFAEQTFVIDVEPQRLCGRVKICAIDEQRYFFTGYRHLSSLFPYAPVPRL